MRAVNKTRGDLIVARGGGAAMSDWVVKEGLVGPLNQLLN